MKKKILLLMGVFSLGLLQAQVGINTTTPHASAALQIESDTKGLLIPRMTSLQRQSISSPAAGLIVYDTNLNCISQNAGTPAVPNWICLANKDAQNSFFYMPTISIPATDALVLKTIDLYEKYKEQFKNVPVTQRNPTAPADIPYFMSATDLEYYVTRYDKDIVQITSVAADGKLQYQIIKEADFDSFMTVVFVMK